MGIDCSTLIVGAGVAGLTAAALLRESGHDVRVLEASSAVGGRVRSLQLSGTSSANARLGDLGPSWVWPRWQPMVARSFSWLDLTTFDQYESGDALIDRSPNAIPERRFLPGQDGMARVSGGPMAIIDSLLDRVGSERVRCGDAVQSLQDDPQRGLVKVRLASGELLTADRVVLAAPPRILAESITFDPPLSARLQRELAAAPTWMAQQAKVVAVYTQAFWRTDDLSGRVASSVGPLVEIHDHCGPSGTPAALFGFVGMPPEQRAADAPGLRAAITAQLVRCFGEQAAQYTALGIQDWAQEPWICSTLDRSLPAAHPAVLADELRAGHWSGRLLFCAAEMSSVSPGLLEGALARGHVVARECLIAQ